MLMPTKEQIFNLDYTNIGLQPLTDMIQYEQVSVDIKNKYTAFPFSTKMGKQGQIMDQLNVMIFILSET
jgi:hypothetical protein